MIKSTEIKGTRSIAMNAKICSILDITPHLRRISLEHELLKDIGPFAPGIHFKVFIPLIRGEKAVLPDLSEGRPFWPDEKTKPAVRTYTIRSIDRVNGTLDVEFVLHGDSGPASAWAGSASIGDYLGIGLRNSGKTHQPSDWYLFAGDETAIPAITAMLEHLPAGTTGVAFLEVANDSDKFRIETNHKIEIHWLIRNGKAPEQSELILNAVQNLTLPDSALKSRYAWIAGEENMVRSMRKYAGEQLGLSREELHATVYWKAGMSEDDYHQIRTKA